VAGRAATLSRARQKFAEVPAAWDRHRRFTKATLLSEFQQHERGSHSGVIAEIQRSSLGYNAVDVQTLMHNMLTRLLRFLN
jgi:hypothetical protein